MNRTKKTLIYVLSSLIILTAAFLLSLFVYEVFNTHALIPSIFTLAVFLISLSTNGYIYGLVAALISVLAVNYAFTFPFFEFDFTIQENMVSAIIMIIVTVVTSTLATKIKRQEMIKAETEREKMRANLLRAVSHDLRTPLTAIYGASSTIIENYEFLTEENKIEMLNGIREDSQWLTRMVENLLSVTKIDNNNNVKLIKTSTVLEELIDSVIAKFNKRYPNQKIVLEIPDDFITISMDAILIEQVIMNLLENAVRHATGMTELILKIHTDEQNVVFEVIDDGKGIEKENLKNIFSGNFHHDDVSADSHKQGMGIGLSVCATIIKAHGGMINARSRKSGGMIFSFTLEMENNDE